MTDRELLISLHQKVDKHHRWVKRQFIAVQANMTVTHNSVRKNRYYLHEIFDRSWAILSHLKTDEELADMDFQMNFDWAEPPRKKFKKTQVPPLMPSSESSSCTTDKNEVVEDTAAGPSAPRDDTSPMYL